MLLAVLWVAMPLTEWQYRAEGAWQALRLPANLERSDKATIELKVDLPAHTLKDPVVAFDSIAPPFEAWFDGQLTQVSPSPEGLAARFPPGMRWQVLGVPPGARELVLRVRTDGQTAVVRGTPVFGERAEVLALAIRRDVPRLIAGGLVILLGLFGLLTSFRRSDWRLPVGYALCTSCLGLYILHYTHLRDVVMDTPRLWFVVWLLIVPLQPVGTLLFLSSLLDSPWLRRLLRVHILVGALVLGCDAVGLTAYAFDGARFGVSLFMVSMVSLRVVIALTTLVAWLAVVRHAWRTPDDARVLAFGFTVFVVAIAADLLASLGAASLSWKSQVHLATVVLAVAFGLILSRRHLQAHERVARAAREKERLLRDLHDGVGTLTSNMRMLAQLGRRNDARAGAALDAISDLSDKALTELRSFVQALDDASMTWESLVAELRRYAGQVVEGAGATLTMTTEVQRGGRPEGLLTLNLLRIFRECLTNALKQKDVQLVTVDLHVKPNALTLVVTNDGGERSADGVNLQRGVGNLQTRAKELGGTFALTLGERAVAQLEVPL